MAQAASTIDSPAVPPYVGPIRPGHTVALIFETSGTARLFAFPFTSLAEAEAAEDLLDFYNHPLQCADCRRPFKRTPSACFTYIFTCPHWPDDAPDSESAPNRAIEASASPFSPEPVHPPLGNVLVVKQAASDIAEDQPIPRAEAMELPLTDVTVSDLADINRYLVEFLPAMWTVDVDGWRYFVRDDVADNVRTPEGRRVFPLRVPDA
ncbi:hypothetical protein C8F01DRAFT_1342508 [Mycena amicta]|nr:hypothetical protein C8F01DRAFT_1322433 [Mycena amicta]KAJ7067466.1 hypothetical protein C8F01DRAFT_1342508 [Mycena amicta]